MPTPFSVLQPKSPKICRRVILFTSPLKKVRWDVTMNAKLNFVSILMAFILGLVLFDNNLSAQNVLSSRAIEIRGMIVPILQEKWGLADKIEEGKELLKNSVSLKFEEVPQKDKRGRIIKKKGQPVMEMVKKEIALAIFDTETGEVFEKRYWLNVAEINKANDLRKKYLDNPNYLPVFRSSDTTKEFEAISNWWNSFNSDISIIRNGAVGGQYVVVANKYLMSNDDLVYPEDKIGAKYSDIVYVPYSSLLKDKTLIVAGKKFLNDYVNEAFKELSEAGVMSKAFPDQLITETMTQTFVKNIFLTEHTDPMMMFMSNDGGLELVERVLIRLGTNGEKAFRYTVSKTGASGLGQIMPKTYASMFKGYSSAKLIKNTDMGRVDVKNGIKAAILVLDDHLLGVKNRAYSNGSASKRRFDALTPDKLEETRGMAYNGGPGKYNTSTGELNIGSRGAKETAGFLKKFRMIKSLNLFD